jgi:hypothetical protein
MASSLSINLDVPVTVAAGEGSSCDLAIEKAVAYTGYGSGTYQIQLSFDGVTYFTFGSPISGDGVQAIPHFAKSVRINTSVAPTLPSEAPTVTLGGVLP